MDWVYCLTGFIDGLGLFLQRTWVENWVYSRTGFINGLDLFTDWVCSLTGFILAADLGGELGLFLGASLLTVLELTDVSCLAIGSAFKRRTNQKTFTGKHK